VPDHDDVRSLLEDIASDGTEWHPCYDCGKGVLVRVFNLCIMCQRLVCLDCWRNNHMNGVCLHRIGASHIPNV
jgi:hypothetical protein